MKNYFFARGIDKLSDPTENRAERKIEVTVFSLWVAEREGERKALLRRQLKLLVGEQRLVPERRHGGGGKSDSADVKGDTRWSRFVLRQISSCIPSPRPSVPLLPPWADRVRADAWIIADLRRPPCFPRSAVNSAAVRDLFATYPDVPRGGDFLRRQHEV